MRIIRAMILEVMAVILVSPLVAAVFKPTTVTQLIANITTANTNAQDDVIDLEKNTFLLIAVNNDDNNEGNNGLPSILPDSSHKLTIKKGVIERSAAAPGFRLLRVAPGAYLILDDLRLRNGLANDDNVADFPGNGGGAILNDGSLVISRTHLENNSSSSALPTGDSGGGAIYNFGGTIVKIEKSVFLANKSLLNYGGAIRNSFDSTGSVLGTILSIDKSTFDANTANLGGGAIANFCTLTKVSDSTFSNNRAAGGGAIYNDLTTGTIINSTFSGNQAVGSTSVNADGGAISNVSGTISALLNSTIAANAAGRNGGGINNNATISNIESTIVATNTAVSGSDIFNNSVITQASFNLIGTNGGGSGIVDDVDENQVGTDADPLNPLLEPLENNGGPTLTMALEPRSPAIDAGANPDNLKFDQRGAGFRRMHNDETDIGAFELRQERHDHDRHDIFAPFPIWPGPFPPFPGPFPPGPGGPGPGPGPGPGGPGPGPGGPGPGGPGPGPGPVAPAPVGGPAPAAPPPPVVAKPSIEVNVIKPEKEPSDSGDKINITNAEQKMDKGFGCTSAAPEGATLWLLMGYLIRRMIRRKE